MSIPIETQIIFEEKLKFSTNHWPILLSTDIQFKSKDPKMCEPIEKIGEVGIGSDYYSGQVYWFKFKCWKIMRGSLTQWVIVQVVQGFNLDDIPGHGLWASHIGFGSPIKVRPCNQLNLIRMWTNWYAMINARYKL